MWCCRMIRVPRKDNGGHDVVNTISKWYFGVPSMSKVFFLVGVQPSFFSDLVLAALLHHSTSPTPTDTPFSFKCW